MCAHIVVCGMHRVDIGARCPRNHLAVQHNVAYFLIVQRERLPDLLAAFFHVDFAGGSVDQLIEL
jgi:hypothetical protein